MRPTFLGLAFLLIVGSAVVYAQSGGYGREGMRAVRAYQTQGFVFERGPQRDERQAEPELERRQSRESGTPDSSGYGTQGESAAAPDQARRHGRLSPEERRALRRQIDEAGQDLYTRKQ